MANHWLSQTLDDKVSRSLEISVVRSEFTIGRQNFGNLGDFKILIFREGGEALSALKPEIRSRLEALAEKTATDMNRKEQFSAVKSDFSALSGSLGDLVKGIVAGVAENETFTALTATIAAFFEHW